MISRRSLLLFGTIATFMRAAAQGQSRVAESPAAGKPIEWEPGTHYGELNPHQPTSVGPGHFEILEFFWYGCSHCYALEPHLHRWEQQKPKDVVLVRVPMAVGRPMRLAHARLYYTLRSLDREDLHQKVFDTIHDPNNRNRLESRLENFEQQAAFAVTHGLDPKDFERAFNAKPVDEAVQRAGQLCKSYRITGVPAMAINGKYLTDAGRAGDQARLISLVSYLIERERVASRAANVR